MKKKKISFLTNLILFLVLFSINPFLVTGQIQNNKTSLAMMPIYGINKNNIDGISQAGFDSLTQMGINHLVIGDWGQANFDIIINKFKTNPRLNNFKLLLGLNGPSYDAYVLSGYSNDLSSPALNDFKLLLDHVINLAKSNSFIGGYYTFDEPAINTFTKDGKLVKRGISKEFQIAVYNYIRAKDADIKNRPVCIANTLLWDYANWGSVDNVSTCISNLAQDLIFVDQYSDNVSTQVSWFQKWKAAGITDPFVYILTAYDNDCTSGDNLSLKNANAIASALTTVYGSNQPANAGVGLFAYWPGIKPDFTKGMDNCAPISIESYNHFKSKGYGFLNFNINSSFCDDGSLLFSSSGIGTTFGLRFIQTDINGNESGSAYTDVISGTSLNGFSLSNWCKTKGIVLKPKSYYKICVSAGHGHLYTESSKIFKYNECTWQSISEVDGVVGGYNPNFNDKRLIGDFDGDGAEELFTIQNSGPLATLLKFNNSTKQWYSVAVSNGAIANSWGISANDNYVVGNFDGDIRDEILFSNPNGWAQMLGYDPSTFKWFVKWHNNGNGWIGSWNILSNVKMIAGDFDSNKNDKELLFVQNANLPCWAMIQDFSGGSWPVIWNNKGDGWIWGWGIHSGDRFLVGDMDGDGTKNDIFCANVGAWSNLISYKPGAGFSSLWDNGGSGWTQSWHYIMPTDVVLAGNLDYDGTDEMLFLTSGTNASYAMTQSFTSSYIMTTNWTNNGDPAQINSWPLYSKSTCNQEYNLIKVDVTKPKNLLATRFCPEGVKTNLYGIVGTTNLKIADNNVSFQNSSVDAGVNNYSPYPNPVSGDKFYVNLPEGQSKEYNIELWDMLGNNILTRNSSKETEEVLVNDHMNGIYLLKIINNGSTIGSYKVVINN